MDVLLIIHINEEDKMTNICVFCAANPAADYGEFKTAAEELGKGLAQKKHTLLYGGSSQSLMGTLADSCLAAGGNVIGVLPEFLREYEIAHKNLTELHFVNDLSERKRLLIEWSDSFIIMPGGLGTLDELLEVWTMHQLQRHNKPIYILNINNFFEHFILFIEHMEKNLFLRKKAKDIITIENHVSNLLEII